MGIYEPRNQDHYAFIKAKRNEDYWNVGSYNIFMKCEKPNQEAFQRLPDGYSFKLCGYDEIEIWAHIAVEAPQVEYVLQYYKKVYAKHKDEFFRHCIFVRNDENKPIATCLLWRSYGKISTIGWLRTLPEYEGRGLGRALLGHILESAEYPVYLHTQPTSVRAIKLYSDFGFKVMTDPIIGFRKNNWTESSPILKEVMPVSVYARLKTVKADKAFLEAAKLSKTAEF